MLNRCSLKDTICRTRRHLVKMLLPGLRTWPSDPRNMPCSLRIQLIAYLARLSLEMKRFKQRHCDEQCMQHAAWKHVKAEVQ